MSWVSQDCEQTGRILAGKLRLDALIASGGMGEIWRARHLGLDKDVAVKILRDDRSSSEDIAVRFIQEARTASRLDHINSVSVLDFGEDPSGVLYLAMELLDGDNLSEILHQRGRLPLMEGCQLMVQVLAGLAAAHDENILHRDIKPSNIILVDRHDDDGHPYKLVKVCDFGLAKFTHHTGPDNPEGQKIIGTPLYMSPEQASGMHTDERSDIYACGVVLFELLTGRPPFEADQAVNILMKHCASPVPKPSSIVEHIPSEADTIVQQALAKEPHKRFQTARELRSAVLSLMRPSSRLSDKPKEAHPTTYFLRSPSQDIATERPTPLAKEPHNPQDTALNLLFEPPVEAPSPPHSASDGEVYETHDFTEAQPINDARYLWERFALSPYRNPPEEGFWLLDSESNHIGPLTFDELALALRLEAIEGSYADNYVATDPQADDWHSAAVFLQTVDALGIPRITPPNPIVTDVSGPIRATTLPALFASTSRNNITGRMIVTSSSSVKTIFFEIHLKEGQPTLVETNILPLQTPSVLIERNIIHEHDLPYLVNDAWQQPQLGTLTDSMHRLADMSPETYYSGVMRTRLRQMLQITEGSFILDRGYIPETRRPFATSLMAILPRVARESIPIATIEATLQPYLHRPLVTYPGIQDSIYEIGFTSNERTIAKEILAAPDLISALPSQLEFRNIYATIAYLMIATSTSI